MGVKSKVGFTLVELSIALIFVGLLSLSMMLIINDSVVAFRRSNMLGQVNTVGMDLVDDITMAVKDSTARSLTDICLTIYSSKSERDKCVNDNAYNFVSVTRTYGENALPIYGVFCTGAYSYVWNSGLFERGEIDTEPVKLVYKNVSGSISQVSGFKLIKFRDDARSACIAAVHPEYDSKDLSKTKKLRYTLRNVSNGGNLLTTNVIDVSKIGNGTIESEPVQLLATGGANELTIYDLMVAMPAVSDKNNGVFYSGSFILGTVGGGINILSKNSACKAPNGYESNLDYCAINKFNFAGRAIGR